jgi:hypothetical protein
MSLNYKLGQLAFHPYSCLLCGKWVALVVLPMKHDVSRCEKIPITLDLVMRNQKGNAYGKIVKLLSQVHHGHTSFNEN